MKITSARVNHSLKRSYQWRWFGNKGIILVLFWTFSVFAFVNYILRVYVSNPDVTNRYKYFIAVAVVGTFFPVVGWLTDVYIGRYRVIKVSLLVLWCGAILWCLADVLHIELSKFHVVHHYLAVCIGTLVSLALGCFVVNIVQFSIDQLLDSSSNEIISFIVWFVWVYYFAKLIAQLQICVGGGYYNYTYSTLYISVLLTLAVSSDFLFSRWLVKEPVTLNPLVLILKVLVFAVKNKYPQRLSELASWNSSQCSRVDLAKTDYGGPFIATQVEDVKRFFRILALIMITSPFFALPLYNVNISPHLSEFEGFKEAACADGDQFGACLKKESIVHAGYLMIVLCIPLYEFIIQPMFWKATQVKIVTRVLIGTFFVFVHVSGLISAEVVGHFTHNETAPSLACMDEQQHYCDSDQGTLIYWLSPLSVVYAIGQSLMLSGGIEYLCAKTPYSMRGLMFGSVITSCGFSMILLHVVFIPFKHYHTITVFGVTLGCVFWFLVTCAAMALLFCILVILIGSCCYKKTQEKLGTNIEEDCVVS